MRAVNPRHNENLPQNRLTDPAERRAYYSKLGKISAQKDRERKNFKEVCRLIASSVIKDPVGICPDYILRFAETQGIERLTFREASAIALTLKAMSGDIRAFEALRDTLGEDPAKATVEEDITIPKAKEFADFIVKTTHRILTEKVGEDIAREVMLEVFRLYKGKVKDLE